MCETVVTVIGWIALHLLFVCKPGEQDRLLSILLQLVDIRRFRSIIYENLQCSVEEQCPVGPACMLVSQTSDMLLGFGTRIVLSAV